MNCLHRQTNDFWNTLRSVDEMIEHNLLDVKHENSTEYYSLTKKGVMYSKILNIVQNNTND